MSSLPAGSAATPELLVAVAVRLTFMVGLMQVSAWPLC
jgi:hypothetical protein